MSQADELLNSLTSGTSVLGSSTLGTMVLGAGAYETDSENESHIVVGADRFVTVPDALKRIAVQHDHDVETVTFDCPRYWDGLDMSQMRVYINYMRKDGYKDCYLAKNVIVDENDDSMMHFDWTVSRNVTEVKGEISFLVCVKITDDTGNETNHWNSELNQEMYVSEGLECCASIVSEYPDIITQLLLRMDYVEEIATPESMQDYVADYLSNDPTTQQQIQNYTYSYLIDNGAMINEIVRGHVDSYLEKHPTVFVVGSGEPTFKALWFNTNDISESTETTIFTVGPDEPTSESLWFDTGENEVTG